MGIDGISSKVTLTEDKDTSCLSAGFIQKVHFPLAYSVLVLPLFFTVFWFTRPKEGR